MKKILLTSSRLITAFLILLFVLIDTVNSAPTVYTLDEAVKTAVQKSYDTKTAKLNVEKAGAQIDEAYGTALPSVNLSGMYQRNLKVPVFFMPNIFAGKPDQIIKVEMGAENAFQASAQFTQILFNSAVFTAIGTSKTFSKSTNDQYFGTLSKTINSVKKSFYGVLLAKSFNNAMQTAFKNASDNVEMVKKFYTEGMIPEFDKIRAEVAVENLRPNLLQSESAVQNALNALKMLMGIDMNEVIDVEGVLEMPSASPEVDETKAIAGLNESNYDLMSVNHLLEVNKDVINIRKSEYFPTLALFGNYSYQGQSNTFDFQTATSSSVGLNISLSLFQGLQSNARVQQAKVDYQVTESKRKQLEEALKMQLKNTFLQMNIAKSKVDAQQKTVEQAQRGYDIALIRYKEGIGSQMEINDADNALIQSKVNKAQAIYEYISAIADYENLTGISAQKYTLK